MCTASCSVVVSSSPPNTIEGAIRGASSVYCSRAAASIRTWVRVRIRVRVRVRVRVVRVRVGVRGRLSHGARLGFGVGLG